MHYINKLGGTKSEDLCILTWNLINWCLLHQVDLIATHIPGIDNILADALSRKILPYHEWELSDRVLHKLFQVWGTPQIDLFATVDNKKLPKFCCLRFHPLAEAVDALSLSWNGKYLYAFPPLPIIRQVLMKVEREQVMMILIAPKWPRRDWFPILLNLLIDYPMRLPIINDLITQQQGTLLHHNPAELQLMAWMISGIDCLQQAFHRKLLQHSWPQEARELTNATNLVGSIFPVGVNHRIWIPMNPLSL
jgi:hypothetical protein